MGHGRRAGAVLRLLDRLLRLPGPDRPAGVRRRVVRLGPGLLHVVPGPLEAGRHGGRPPLPDGRHLRAWRLQPGLGDRHPRAGPADGAADGDGRAGRGLQPARARRPGPRRLHGVPALPRAHAQLVRLGGRRLPVRVLELHARPDPEPREPGAGVPAAARGAARRPPRARRDLGPPLRRQPHGGAGRPVPDLPRGADVGPARRHARARGRHRRRRRAAAPPARAHCGRRRGGGRGDGRHRQPVPVLRARAPEPDPRGPAAQDLRRGRRQPLLPDAGHVALLPGLRRRLGPLRRQPHGAAGLHARCRC